MPAEIVHKDDLVTAFRDVNPQAPTHVLVVPNKHIPALTALGDDERRLVGHIIQTAVKVAESEGLNERGFRVVANCGPEAGQSVDHVHFHLLGGRALGWPPG